MIIKELQPFMIKSGNYMRYRTRQMLQKIIDSRTLENVQEAFECRQNQGTH